MGFSLKKAFGGIGNFLGIGGGKQGEYFTPQQQQQNALFDFTNKVDNDALYKKGGLYDTLGSDLQRDGSKFTANDYEVFGQTAGDIARRAGQEERGLMQMAQQRGLSSAPSGALGLGFSGISGNKLERLASAQTQLAQRRMDTNMQRLNQLSGLRAQRQGELQNAAATQQNANVQNLASLEDKRNNKSQGLLQGFGQGLFSSAQQTGAAPGTFVSSLAGGSGRAMSGGGLMSGGGGSSPFAAQGIPSASSGYFGDSGGGYGGYNLGRK